MTSPTGVPMATCTFLGWATAEPSTVSRFSTSGMPVFRYRARNATDVTFITTQPTSAGSLPGGTCRPVQAAMSTFSAPWGYRAGRDLTSTCFSGWDTLAAMRDSSAMAAASCWVNSFCRMAKRSTGT